jgi:hypothetical protein
MADSEVREALLELEAGFGFDRPIGAAELPDQVRFFRVLAKLRDTLCPKLQSFARAADTKASDLVSVVSDTILATVGHFPVPAVTIGKHIVNIGIDQFCADPTTLLTEAADPTGPDDESTTA